MKALVVYFSQTGNTEQVARAVGRGLAEAGCEPVDVRPLAETSAEDWRAYDLFGLGAPVFYYHEPQNVRDWIRRLVPRRHVPAFTFITHGGNPANTLRRMQRLLRPKGAHVSRSFECFGYDTYPIYVKDFRQWGHPDADELAAALGFGRDVADDAARMLAGEDVPEASYPFVGGKTFRLSLVCRRPLLDYMMPRLEVKRDLCTRCGACVRHCPTNNISLDPWPRFADRCIRCYLCERVCPHNAIQCDWRLMAKVMNP
ncbi:MAG: EFR1 family ferrodoxin [Phycisphaerae bacterium]